MENSTTDFYFTAKKIGHVAVKSGSECTTELELQRDTDKHLFSVLHLGSFYYFIFNFFHGAFDFVSEEIRSVLGYEPEDYTAVKMLDKIHLDDKIYFLNFEQESIKFFKTLSFDKVKKYKAQYDYRIKSLKNQYVRILQQIVPIEYDETNFDRTFSIHSDISHIKQNGIPCFSIIRIVDEPSYYNIQDRVVFYKSDDFFTKRENEILKYIVAGKNSNTIANELHIRLHTVNTHRKNMLIKANCKSPIDLVTKVINEVLIRRTKNT